MNTLSRKDQQAKNEADRTTWRKLCAMARALRGVSQASIYHALIHSNVHTPPLFELKQELERSGFWSFFSTRAHNYEAGLLGVIFEPTAL